MKEAFQSFTKGCSNNSKFFNTETFEHQENRVKSTVNVCGRIIDGCVLILNLNGTQMTQIGRIYSVKQFKLMVVG